MFHLTINGRPMCRHTSCVAGIGDAQQVFGSVRSAQCSFDLIEEALDVAKLWAERQPYQRVALVFGDCPELDNEEHV